MARQVKSAQRLFLAFYARLTSYQGGAAMHAELARRGTVALCCRRILSPRCRPATIDALTRIRLPVSHSLRVNQPRRGSGFVLQGALVPPRYTASTASSHGISNLEPATRARPNYLASQMQNRNISTTNLPIGQHVLSVGSRYFQSPHQIGHGPLAELG